MPGRPSGVTLARPAGTTEYADPHTGTTRTWEYGTWTSPVTRVGFDASELIASWNAETPAGTWIQVEMQGNYTSGDQTPWYVMGRWASGDKDIRRTSVDRQGDPWSTIWTDTFSIDDAAAGVLLRAYQLRLTLYRAPGQTAAPGGPDAGRDELHRAGPVHRAAERRPHRLGPGAAGAALLAEHPRRPVPRVRRRRRGLVLADLDRDGRRVLGPQAVGRPTPSWVDPTYPTRRSTTPPG